MNAALRARAQASTALLAVHVAPQPAPRCAQLIAHAKKKGGGKKGGGKKKGGQKKQGSGIPKAGQVQQTPWKSPEKVMELMLMMESYRRAAHRPLVARVDVTELGQTLHDAPYALLMHNRYQQGVADADAVYTYANKIALDLFEAEQWSDLVGKVSTCCLPEGDADAAAGREQALTAAAESEALEPCPGKRVGLKGKAFQLDEAVAWTVRSPTGDVYGQAARIDSIVDSSGAKINLAAPPTATQEEVDAQTARVDEQAEAVRRLKDDDGLSNEDPKVKAAVEELLARKATLAALAGSAAAEAAEAVRAVAR